MLTRMTIKTRLIFLMGLSAFLLIVTGGEGVKVLQENGETLRDSYDNWVLPIKHLKDMSEVYRLDVVRLLRLARTGHLSAEEAQEGLRAAGQRIDREWQAFRASDMTEAENRAIEAFLPVMQRMDDSLKQVPEYLRKGDLEALRSYLDTIVYPNMDQVVFENSKLIDLEIDIVKQGFDGVIVRYGFQRNITVGIILVGIILGAILGLSIIRSITRSLGQVSEELRELAIGEADLTQRIPVEGEDEVGDLSRNFNHLMDNLLSLVRRVHTSGIQVTSSSTQIAASAKELEATVAEQVASTNEVVATTREISANSQELVQTVAEVSALSEKTAVSAGAGQEGLRRMGTAMGQMEEASRSISSRLAVINEKANNINSVVGTINKVADQTNLLSLNAAIEAEKAGEYGLGFSVVAREIRRLADQTAVATLDIEQMVREMQTAVSAGVMEMDKFSEEVRRSVEEVGRISAQLGQIIEQVEALTPRFETVNEGMQAQAQGAQQISEAMVQLSEAARQTAESLRETNGAIGQLNEAARGLQQEVSRFKVG